MSQSNMTGIRTEEDRRKLTELYQLYENAMYNIAYSILHDRFLAEDAVNEAFIKLIRYLSGIMDVKCHKTKALIVIIVKSTAIDIYRKRRKQYEYETEELDEQNNIDDTLLNRIIAEESYHELMLRLKSLKKEYQEIILLKYVYQLSNKEISHLMSISEDLVRQHICRAKRAVKKLMEENDN